MPTINVNGVSTHYQEMGHGPAVVLIHGFPVDSRMWQAQLEGLSATHRVIAPDLRGAGQSPVAGPFSIEALADDVQELAQALSLGSFVLGGLSMGGYVVLAYVKKYQPTLRGLMLVDTRPDADAPQARENRDKMIAALHAEGAAPVASSMLARLIPESTAKTNGPLVQELRAMMESQPPQGMAHALAAMRDRPDQTPMLPSIGVPTLIVCGEKDAVTPSDVMKVFHDNIPRSQFRIIPDAGHMTPMEQPAMVNQVMLEFLAGV